VTAPKHVGAVLVLILL